MRCSLFTVLLTLIWVGGCGKDDAKRPRGRDPERTTEEQVEMLKSLNRLVSENQEAIGEVFPDETSTAVSEKVSKMATLIRKGQCRAQGRRPHRKFDRSWSNEFEVASEGCPVRLLENGSYSHELRTWKTSQLFENRSPDYRELNTVERMDGSGSVWVKEKNGVVRIQGAVVYKEFRVAGIGNMTYKIETDQEYPGLNRGRGQVFMTLRLPNQWQHSASIQWSFPEFKRVYMVNGEKVDEKLFLEMFSAFGIIEIMYLSLDMR